VHKFLLDKRVRFLEEQLSKFYWPIYLHLQKDNLIWDRLKERTQDPDNAQSRLSLQIESGVILPNHKEALAVIEDHLHLAGDASTVEPTVRFEILQNIIIIAKACQKRASAEGDFVRIS
jgi:hypothetical protein